MNPQAMPGYFFMPQHIVLVGASERPHSLGERILTALLSTSFQGKVTPVNLRHKSVAGIKAYPDLTKIDGNVDLVIAATPPESYETLFKSCRKQQFHHLILIQDWNNLPAESLQTAANAIKKHHGSELNISVCTPAGIQLPTQGINTGILPDFAAGHVALLSGHSAVSREIDFMLRKMKQGISRHISLHYGLSPTTAADWLNHFGHNRHTRVAVIQYNPQENRRKLFSAIRHFARHTPVILYCLHAVDETEHALLSALSRRCNFLTAFCPQELEASLQAVLSGIRPVSQLTVLADIPAQWLHAPAKKAGIRLEVPSETPQGTEDLMRLRALAAEALHNKHTEALLVLLGSRAETQENATIRMLQNLSQQSSVPLLISNRLADGLLQFGTPGHALDMLHARNTAARLHDAQNEIAPPKSGRLKNIRTQKAVSASAAHDFAKLAQALHLPEFGTDGFHTETQLAFKNHPRYGRFIAARYQGRTLAVLPPFTTLDTAQLIGFTGMQQHQTHIEQFVHSMNGLDIQPHLFEGEVFLNMEGASIRSSFNPSETPAPPQRKRKSDLNHTNKMAAAAEFIRSTGEAAAGLWQTKGSTATETLENVCTPYPSGFPRRIELNNGQTVTVRPFEPEDAEAKQDFVRSLSPRARHTRFMSATNELPQTTLARLSKLDYYSEGAFIAESPDGSIIGVSRFSRLTRDECEFSIALSENVRGTGLADAMMRLIIRLATQQGYVSMSAEILKENTAMLKLAEKSGFVLFPSQHDAALVQAKRFLMAPDADEKTQQSQ